jgi:hypothetical protein
MQKNKLNNFNIDFQERYVHMKTQTGETAGRKEALTVSRLIEGQMLSNRL